MEQSAQKQSAQEGSGGGKQASKEAELGTANIGTEDYAHRTLPPVQPAQEPPAYTPAQEQPAQEQPAQGQEPLMQVLVVGGRGFLGHRLVEILNDPARLPFGRKVAVHVADLELEGKLDPGATANQHYDDITDVKFVHSLLHKLIPGGPEVVFNTLSEEPRLGLTIDTPRLDYYERNYEITSLLLEEAKKAPFVKAFVQSSSVAVVRFSRQDELLATEENTQLVDLTDFKKSLAKVEDHTYVDHTYVDTMAAADELVLSYNDPLSLATCCLRLPAVYGPNDSNITIPLIERKFPQDFMGNNKEFDALYVDNAVEAHILAAKSLLSCQTPASPSVDGQAFFITDGNPMPFERFTKEFQTAATALEKQKEENLAQPKLALKSLGRASTVTDKLPWSKRDGEKYMSRFVVDWIDHSRTYSVDKAKERLTYEPIVETTKGVQNAVGWAMGSKRKTEESLQNEAKKMKKKGQKKEKKESKKESKNRRQELVDGKVEGTVSGTIREPRVRLPPHLDYTY